MTITLKNEGGIGKVNPLDDGFALLSRFLYDTMNGENLMQEETTNTGGQRFTFTSKATHSVATFESDTSIFYKQ